MVIELEVQLLKPWSTCLLSLKHRVHWFSTERGMALEKTMLTGLHQINGKR